MDMEFGPDGALYILEYGDGYFSENPDAKLTKVNFVRGNNSPEVRVQAAGQPDPNVPLEGLPPLTVNFTSDGTVDRDGDRLSYAWDFDSDGEVDSREPADSFTYEENGTVRRHAEGDRPDRAHVVRLRADHRRQHDAEGDADDVARAGPAVPVRPDVVTYTVTVADDSPVDCTRVKVSYVLGHDQHGHPLYRLDGLHRLIITTAAGHEGAAEHPRSVRRLVHRRAPGGRAAADRHGPGRADPRRLTESGRDGGAAPSRRPRFPAVTPG